MGVWAYLLLAVVVIAEGPVATLAGAVAASNDLMEPWAVFFTAASANLVSDMLWYVIGYQGKKSWILRHGRWLGLTEEHIQRLEGDIHSHAPKLLVMAKLTLGLAIPVLVATGMARVPVKRWLLALVSAETVWTGTLVILGYTFGGYLRSLERGVQIVAIAGTLVLVSGLIFYFSRYKKRKTKG